MNTITLKHYPLGNRFYSKGTVLRQRDITDFLFKGFNVVIYEDKTCKDITNQMISRSIGTYLRNNAVSDKKLRFIIDILKG